MAAIQPSTYDMSTILYKDITCGTLKLRGTEERERYLTQCWLNGSIWKFKGPVLAMLLVNFEVIVALHAGFAKTISKFLKKLKNVFLKGYVFCYRNDVCLLPPIQTNLAIFVIVLRVSFGRIESTSYVQTTKLFFLSRKGLKAIFALLPLLGVTFLLGFFVDCHVAVEYAFVLLNSIQGVLFFICHCVLDDQVRNAMNKMLRKRKRVHSLQQ
ncbi:unnamed protein product, partial [Pocillopora meandrina]